MEVSDDDLVRAWRSRKDAAAYKELRRRHTGLVMYHVNKYAAASVPRAALEAEGWRLFDEGVTAYKPGSAAKFSSFVSYYLMRLDRYTKTNQNVARIPEGLSSQIGKYDRAHSQLVNDLGREPTTQELASATKMAPKRLLALEGVRRRDLFEGGYEGEAEVDAQRAAYNRSLLVDARDLLNPQERTVYDKLIGHNTPQVTDKQRIARELGISPGRVSQISNEIARKIKPHLDRGIR